MKALTYYISLPFLYLISFLPFPILYLISDLLFLISYHLVGYRRDVVFNNLRNSFPERDQKEIKRIAGGYYRHLCDMLVESFKTLTITPSQMLKRCSIHPDAQLLFDQYVAEQRNIIIAMGHLGNWEWGANTFGLSCRQQLYAVYHPLSNTYFNNLVIRMRMRFGSKVIPMRDTYKVVLKNRAELSAIALIADQSPVPESAYWTHFLHQDTGFFTGVGKMAVKMNYPVVYLWINKEKRGRYQLMAERLVEDPLAHSEAEITEAFVRKLEQDVIKHPETWLWSHRRWKHKRVNN